MKVPTGSGLDPDWQPDNKGKSNRAKIGACLYRMAVPFTGSCNYYVIRYSYAAINSPNLFIFQPARVDQSSRCQHRKLVAVRVCNCSPAKNRFHERTDG